MRFIHYFLGCWLISGVKSLLNTTVAAKLNGYVTLPCRLPMPVEKDVTVHWFSGENKLLTSGLVVLKHRDRMSITKPAPNEWNLRIEKLDISFADKYTCRTDTKINVSLIELVIENSPRIDDSLSTTKQYKVQEGNQAIMICIASGIPTPTVEWFRGTVEKAIGVYGSQLIIQKVERYASDVYKCRATNKNGEASKTINLDVTFEPEVKVMSSEVYASTGEAVVMSCVVQGSPITDVFWTDNSGKTIMTNWKYSVMSEDTANGIPVKFINLIFRRATTSIHDSGTYTCKARGENKLVTNTVQLKLKVGTKQDGEKIINY